MANYSNPSRFLDEAGLQALWNKIVTLRSKSPYAICSTAGATATKTVTIEGFELTTGASVCIKFANTNSAKSPKLNVSSTGAKNILCKSLLKSGDINEFIYDGTNWVLLNESELPYLRHYKHTTKLDYGTTTGESWWSIGAVGDTDNSAVLYSIRAYAHTSAIFTVSKGWASSGNITVLQSCTGRNASYPYLKGVRLLSDGVVQIKLNNGSQAPDIDITALSADGTIAGINSLYDNLTLHDPASTATVIHSIDLVDTAIMAKKFVGNLTGNVTGDLTGDVTGTATNATNVNIATSSSNSDYPLLFTSNVTAGNKRIYTDSANELKYNPSTNTLTTTKFKGDLEGNLTLKSLSLCGATESNEIKIVENANGAITTNPPSSTLSSIRKALDFCWYDSHWQIGNIRASNKTSDGFGVTYGNDNLRFRVTTTDCFVGADKILHAGNYTDYTVKKDGTGASGTWGINISGNANTATSADSVHWNNVSNKPTVLTANGSSGAVDIDTLKTNGTYYISYGATANSPGHYGQMLCMKNMDTFAQLYVPYQHQVNNSTLCLRYRGGLNSTGFYTWKSVLDDTNYTSYTVKKDGTGASGTWGINISGNAASATKLTSDAGSTTQPIYFSGGKPAACTCTLGTSVPANAKFTDTDTKVTSVGNHYSPSENTDSALSASGGTLTDIANHASGIQVVTGLKRDAKGHVVGVNSVALKATNNTYTLPNCFKTIDCPRGTDPVADSTTDTLTLADDSMITVTGDSTNDKISFAHATPTTPPTKTTSGLYKVTIDKYGHITAAAAVQKSDITGLDIPGSDTTYSNATQSAAGLMSATDKAKLDGIASNANNYTLPVASTSARGGIKIGYSQTGVNFPVLLSSEKAYVQVGTATTSGMGTLKVAGSRDSSITTTQGGTTSNRYYGVEVDKDGKAFVNVPWTNTDNYTLPTTQNINPSVTIDGLNADKVTELTSESLTLVEIKSFGTASSSRVTTYGLMFRSTGNTEFRFPTSVLWANGVKPCTSGSKLATGFYEIIFTYTPYLKQYTATWAKYS